jgi:caffeoyl-CoA O-methyltransferase
MLDPRIEAYAIAHTSPPGPEVAALRAETEAAMERPQMAGRPVETKLLEALVVATRATRVLEIGTFTGVSALSMASRLQPGGKLITLEADETAAAVARRHLEASPWADRVELLLGDALESVRRLEGPFDLVFIDAWKRDYIAHYEAVVPRLAAHGLIVADNVLWGGAVVDPGPEDHEALALRAFAEHVHADERVDSALLTVGDGLLVIWRRSSGAARVA